MGGELPSGPCVRGRRLPDSALHIQRWELVLGSSPSDVSARLRTASLTAIPSSAPNTAMITDSHLTIDRTCFRAIPTALRRPTRIPGVEAGRATEPAFHTSAGDEMWNVVQRFPYWSLSSNRGVHQSIGLAPNGRGLVCRRSRRSGRSAIPETPRPPR